MSRDLPESPQVVAVLLDAEGLVVQQSARPPFVATGSRFVDRVHPDDRARVAGVLAGAASRVGLRCRLAAAAAETWHDCSLDLTPVGPESGAGLWWLAVTAQPAPPGPDASHDGAAARGDVTIEARLRDFANAGSDWFWETDAELRFSWISENVENITGAPRERAYGRTRQDLRDPSDDRPEWQEHERAIAARQPFRNFEYLVSPPAIDASRTKAWLRVSGVPYFDETGSFLGYRGTGSDVTEFREAQEALRRSEQETAAAAERARIESQFRRLIEHAQDILCVLDQDGTFTYVSPSIANVLGYEPEAVVGTYCFALVHPEDQGIMQRLFHTRVEPGEDRRRQFRYRHADGSWVMLEATGQTSIVDGQPQAVINARDIGPRLRDQEALRESEARLRAILDNAPIHIFLRDPSGVFQMVNQSAAAFLGVQPEEAIGRSLADYQSAETLREVEDQDRQVLLRKRPIVHELPLVSADGNEHIFQQVDFPILDESGKPVALGTIGRDITAQRELEHELRQAQKMEALGQLTGGVAHDFNNLLAVILGNAELLGATIDGQTPGVHAGIQAILRATEKGASLTQRLLAFSRRQTLEARLLHVGDQVSEMTELLRRTLGETIEVETRCDPDLWRCFADPGQLGNAILNLAINARDAMPAGGRLVISTSNQTIAAGDDTRHLAMAAGDYVALTVIDNGGGMTPEILEHVFEPFFTTKDVGKGTGLGLSMVFGFVKQSGGHVAVESQPAIGTTVRLYLPRVADAATVSAPPEGEERPAPVSLGERVLVVEDDPDVRTLIVRMLQDLGYVVFQAGSGEAARKLLQELDPIDLLLSDIVLPGGVRGFEVAEEAARQQAGLRTLFMSGYSLPRLAQSQGLREGVLLLRKPFTVEELARKVREALRTTESGALAG